MDSVSSLLCSILGGVALAFAVCQLSDRVFCFSVSCQAIGFQVLNLCSFETDTFKVFFHLWHEEGPQWRQEFHAWQSEQDAQWSAIRKFAPFSHRSFPSVLIGANTVSLGSGHYRPQDPSHAGHRRSTFERMSFPRVSVFNHLSCDQGKASSWAINLGSLKETIKDKVISSTSILGSPNLALSLG
jgi:hypothetical protein